MQTKTYKTAHRFTRCAVCHKPLRQFQTGRRRETCSHACRQKMHAGRKAWREADERAWEQDQRRAERELRRIEKRYGPIDDRPGADGSISLRRRYLLRLNRRMPFIQCPECGRPIIRDAINRIYLPFCSSRCEYLTHQRRKALGRAVYELGHDISRDALLIEHITRRQAFSICPQCGKPFASDQKTGRPRRYCSLACRQAAYWTRQHGRVVGRKTCAGCGERFAARHPHQLYCTKPCKKRAIERRWYAKRAKTHFRGECILCGKKLDGYPPKGPRPQYCSVRCRYQAYWRRMKQRREAALGGQARRCGWCGKALGWEAHGGRKYCSDRCWKNMKNQRERLKYQAGRVLSG